MTEHRSTIDITLERALGSATLSPEQRRRHLNRVAERASRRRHGLPLRLLRDGGVAVVLVAIMIAAYAMLPVGESSEPGTSPRAALVDMLDEFSAPEPGEARHRTVVGRIDFPPGAPNTEWTGDIWERVTLDGAMERAIIVYAADGSAIGRTVETVDEWIVETPGHHQSGPSTELMRFPPEVLSITPAVRMTATDDSLRGFLDGAFEYPGVEFSWEGNHVVVNARGAIDVDDETLAAWGEELGMAVTALSTEVTFDPEGAQVVRWRALIEDEHGERHETQSFEFSLWESIEPTDIPDVAFAERTELSEQEIEVPLPEQIELSIGTLEIRDAEMTSTNHGLITYVGPAPLLIQVRVSPRSEPVDPDHPEVTPIEVAGVTGYWRGDQFQPDWPRHATWKVGDLHYSLNARNLPAGGWTEDDLYEMIEAITNHR